MKMTGHDRIALQTAIEKRVEECYQIAEAFYRRQFQRPNVRFSLGTTTAGNAHYNRNQLNFNVVLAFENQEEYFTQVVPHEVAHIISVKLYGILNGSGHGVQWAGVMRECFGLKPDQYHLMDTSTVKAKRGEPVFKYQCSCKVHKISGIKHRQMQVGRSPLRCVKCKGTLSFIGEE